MRNITFALASMFVLTACGADKEIKETMTLPEAEHTFEVVNVLAGKDDSVEDKLGELKYTGSKPLEMQRVHIHFELQGDTAKPVNFRSGATLKAGDKVALVEPIPNYIPKSWKGKTVNISVLKQDMASIYHELWTTSVVLK